MSIPGTLPTLPTLSQGLIGWFHAVEDRNGMNLLLTAFGEGDTLSFAIEGMFKGKRVSISKEVHAARDSLFRLFANLPEEVQTLRRSGKYIYEFDISLRGASDPEESPAKRLTPRLTIQPTLATPGSLVIDIDGLGEGTVHLAAIRNECNPWGLIIMIVAIVIAAVATVDHFVNCRTAVVTAQPPNGPPLVSLIECGETKWSNYGGYNKYGPFIPIRGPENL